MVGCYVKVVRVPEHWESGGEDDDDRLAYLGHVGLVVEVESVRASDPFFLVRFPSHKAEATGQRNIELSCLEFVSYLVSPVCDACLEG